MLIQILKEYAELKRKTNNKKLNYKYNNYTDLVLENGRSMPLIELPPRDIIRGTIKGCYFNCLKILEKRNDLNYCEGYGLVKDLSLPFTHAWLCDIDGNALAPTWDDGIEYYGVVFNNDWVKDFLFRRLSNTKTENCLSLLKSNYLEKFSFLKDGFPDSAIIKY